MRISDWSSDVCSSDLIEQQHLPRRMLLLDVYLPHVVSYLFPAWITALAMAWKIVVMAELLATQDDVGAALAVSRSHLDTSATMACITSVRAEERSVGKACVRTSRSWS